MNYKKLSEYYPENTPTLQARTADHKKMHA